MIDYDKEHQAWELLQWQIWSLPGEFEEDLAAKGYYTDLQRKRSDQALDAWGVQHPEETSEELAAFKELERLGVYGQHTWFSPSKAKDGFYKQRLRQHQERGPKPARLLGPSRTTQKRRRQSRWRND